MRIFVTAVYIPIFYSVITYYLWKKEATYL